MGSATPGSVERRVAGRPLVAGLLCSLVTSAAHAQDAGEVDAAKPSPAVEQVAPAIPSGEVPPAAAAPASRTNAARGEDTATRLYVEDGQLLSQPFWVFVTHHIEPTMKPELQLFGGHLVTESSELETKVHDAEVYPDQYYPIEDAKGMRPSVKGTLLRFEFAASAVRPFKAAVRLRPVLKWVEDRGDGQGPRERFAVAEREIYLGNMVGGLIWMGVVLCVVLVALLSWSASKSGRITTFTPRGWLLLITGPDGYLSLWRTQLFLWTLAVSGLVFLFGLLRLQVPEVPESLVVLMGLSLATGGLSAGKAGKDARRKLDEANGASADQTVRKEVLNVNKNRAQWSDLISAWNPALQDVEMSLPKAQMVLWTVVVLVLFVVKSMLSGQLWDVPWTLVTLTGISQAGYVSGKFMPDAASGKLTGSKPGGDGSRVGDPSAGADVPVHVK